MRINIRIESSLSKLIRARISIKKVKITTKEIEQKQIVAE
jgi:hypothetical protein